MRVTECVHGAAANGISLALAALSPVLYSYPRGPVKSGYSEAGACQARGCWQQRVGTNGQRISPVVKVIVIVEISTVKERKRRQKHERRMRTGWGPLRLARATPAYVLLDVRVS